MHGHKPPVTDASKPNNYTKMIGYNTIITPIFFGHDFKADISPTMKHQINDNNETYSSIRPSALQQRYPWTL